MDKLTALLTHFSLHAGVFYTGNICGIHNFEKDALRGHIHLIKRGPVQAVGVQKEVINITEPTILFLPRPETHRLVADDRAGAVWSVARFSLEVEDATPSPTRSRVLYWWSWPLFPGWKH